MPMLRECKWLKQFFACLTSRDSLLSRDDSADLVGQFCDFMNCMSVEIIFQAIFKSNFNERAKSLYRQIPGFF